MIIIHPILIIKFIELAEQKLLAHKIFNFKVVEYEAETQWSNYPPCVQKLIQEGWSGNNRNNFLFNVLVLESKKDQQYLYNNLSKLLKQKQSNVSTPLPASKL